MFYEYIYLEQHASRNDKMIWDSRKKTKQKKEHQDEWVQTAEKQSMAAKRFLLHIIIQWRQWERVLIKEVY